MHNLGSRPSHVPGDQGYFSPTPVHSVGANAPRLLRCRCRGPESASTSSRPWIKHAEACDALKTTLARFRVERGATGHEVFGTPAHRWERRGASPLSSDSRPSGPPRASPRRCCAPFGFRGHVSATERAGCVPAHGRRDASVVGTKVRRAIRGSFEAATPRSGQRAARSRAPSSTRSPAGEGQPRALAPTVERRVGPADPVPRCTEVRPPQDAYEIKAPLDTQAHGRDRSLTMAENAPQRFKPNWLTWPVDRQNRHSFRAYVVEPREPHPERHAEIFYAAFSRFFPPTEDYLRASGSARRSRSPARFDLVTFPEAFLPSATLVEFLDATSRHSMQMGCVHSGLRPLARDGTHLFEVTELRRLVDELRSIPGLCGDDLAPFAAWLGEQEEDDRFNVGGLFTVDAEQQVRLCLHPKLVKSKFESSRSHDANMKEANLLSLVTLQPIDKNASRITIQPLLCSDILNLTTDIPDNHPLEAIARHRSCFPEIPADNVDIVSVATCTPSTVAGRAGAKTFEWHQEFRKAFERAAGQEQCRRHHQAAFVLSNFLSMKRSPDSTPGGLSGVFLSLPTYDENPYPKYVSQSMSIVGRFKDSSSTKGSEERRWIRGDSSGQKQARETGLGYIVALDPNMSCDKSAAATMFGFTISHLPREANRWLRTGCVEDLELHDVITSLDNGESRLELQLRTGL